jgi:hypothetical protein
MTSEMHEECHSETLRAKPERGGEGIEKRLPVDSVAEIRQVRSSPRDHSGEV